MNVSVKHNGEDIQAFSCLGILLFIPIMALLNAWILVKLWAWFIVPTFHLPVLRLAAAYGVTLIVGFLVHETDKPDSGKKLGDRVCSWIVAPLVFFLFGWIAHFCDFRNPKMQLVCVGPNKKTCELEHPFAPSIIRVTQQPPHRITAEFIPAFVFECVARIENTYFYKHLCCQRGMVQISNASAIQTR